MSVEWDDEYENVVEQAWSVGGLDCLVALVRSGSHRCGYVRIPDTHLYHGMNFWEVPVQVHGNLSFSRDLEALGRDGWWIGFDCAHKGDVTNYFPQLPIYNRMMSGPFAHWWTLEEVVAEVEHMARQVIALQPAEPLFHLEEHQG